MTHYDPGFVLIKTYQVDVVTQNSYINLTQYFIPEVSIVDTVENNATKSSQFNVVDNVSFK